MIAIFQHNILQHCWAQHVAHTWLPCYDVLQRVGCCWLKFENGELFHTTFVDVAYCTRLARFMQQCRARACTLVRFARPNMSQHVTTGWPNACNMLCPTMWHRNVAIIWLGLANTGPTMLRYVALKSCDRLAGT